MLVLGVFTSAMFAACQPAPDEATWAEMSEQARAEAQARSLERNSGVIELSPTCEECSIVAHPVATLGDPTDPAGVVPGAEVAADSAATRFYVSSRTFGDRIFVFGQDGRLMRTQGRPGEGPGEFAGQLFLDVGPGDSLHVLQSRPARYTVWTPAGELARTVPLDGGFQDFEVLPSGDLVLSAPTPGPDGQVFRLVQLSPAGETVRMFDPAPGDEPAARFRRLGVAGAWLWVASLARYELDAFDADGVHRTHLEADPDWEAEPGFRPGLRPEPGSAIPGQTTGVTGTRSSQVFVLTALPPEGARFGDAPGPPAYRTLVQLVNLGRHQVLAASELEGLVTPMDEGLVHRIVEGPDGSTRIEVLRLDLDRGRR
jgi:hypothetical protein